MLSAALDLHCHRAIAILLFYDAQERYDEAEGQYWRVLTGREEILGKDHTSTLEAFHWLGSIYKRMKRFEEAEETLQRVLKGKEELLGKDRKSTLNTLYKLGTNYFS